MDISPNFNNPQNLAAEMVSEIQNLPQRNTPNERAVRMKYSRILKKADPTFVLEMARTLLKEFGFRWHAYELIANHEPAFQLIGEKELVAFGKGINSWWTVDAFARTLSGPAWLQGQISDKLIERWAHSDDCWWRRAALVSTVALNMRSKGGKGDVERTLKVCRQLVDDHDDMVVKAMSWALRELVVHDAFAVSTFLDEHDKDLAARVKREVRNKLNTGLKNPGAKRD